MSFHKFDGGRALLSLFSSTDLLRSTLPTDHTDQIIPVIPTLVCEYALYRNWLLFPLSLSPLRVVVAHENRTVGRHSGRKSSLGDFLVGVDSREIFRGKLRARCIIGGRETSVIYHKLRELLAQKTRLGELTRNAVYRFIELFIKWGNEAIGGRGVSSLFPRPYAIFNASVSFNKLFIRPRQFH